MKNSQILNKTILKTKKRKWTDRKINFLSKLLLLSFFPALSEAQVYVNAASTGTQNGTSWTNAYKTLDAALKANLSNASLDVRVAAGTYNEPANAQATLTGAVVSITGGYNVTTGVSDPVATPSIINYSATTTAGGTSTSVGIISYTGTGGSFKLQGLTIQNLNQAALGGGVPTSSNFRGTSFFTANSNTTSTMLFKDLILTNNTKVTDLFQIGNPWPLGSPTATSTVTFDNVNMNNNTTSMGAVNYVGNGVLTVNNSNFCSNASSANFTAGIYYQSLTGGLVVDNSIFQKNTLSNGANLHAGAILICNEYSQNMNANIYITNSSFVANKDYTSSTGVNCVGAVYVSGYLTQGSVLIDNNKFINNEGPYTGALKYTSPVNGIVSNNTFNGNKGTGTYGLSGAIGGSGLLTVNNNTFANNTGTSGGAIYGNGYTISLTGNNFSNNTRTNSSTTFPTDIYLNNSTGSLTNNNLQSAATLYSAEGLTINSGNTFSGSGSTSVASLTTPTGCSWCNAGTSAPTLSSTTATNVCPASTVNLNNYLSNTTSFNLVWYTNNTHTGTAITNSGSAGAGTYYAFFYDAVNNCYSPSSSPITVTINTCSSTTNSCASSNIIRNPSFEMYTSCPTTGQINSLQSNAKYWSNVGTAELMIVNSTCAAGNPTASSGTGVWSGATLSGGHTGAAWTGFHGAERAVDSLATTLQPGTYTVTFWAGYATDNQGIYTTGCPMGVYNSAGTLLGSSTTVSNHLSTSNQTWQQYSITFTTTVATNTLQFGATGAGYLYLDDVVLAVNPTLSASTASNSCPATSVNLNSYVSNAGLNNVAWFTNNTHTGPAITNSGSAGAGTYYAYFYDATNNCFSAASNPLTVTINSCTTPTAPTCGNINYFKNPSFECYNLCPTPTANRVTNTVCGWLDAGFADPQFFVYNAGGGCVFNTFYGSSTTSQLTSGHTGLAWMGLANSDFTNFSTMHPLAGVLEAPLQPGTYTMTFWAGKINNTSYFNNPVVKIYGLDSLHQHPWSTGFYGEVTGTINPTLGTVTVTNDLNNVTNNWQQYTITFTTTKVFKSLVMYHQTANAYLMVDDIQLLATDPYCCDAASNNKGMYCDYDGDSVLNWKDLDDDNDGILDAVENSTCFYSASEVNANYPTFATTAQNITTGLINLGSFTSIFNAFDGNVTLSPPVSGYSNYATFQSYQVWGGKSLFNWNYNAPIAVTGFTMLSSTSYPTILGSAGSTIMLMGSNDGTTWSQMSAAVNANVNTNIVLNNTLQPNTAFKYYKIIGVTGGTGGTDVCGSIVEVVPNVNTSLYVPSSNPKPNCSTPLDTDVDGLANMFDLDSDGDGCPDAIEGSASFTGSNLKSSTLNGGNTGTSYTGTVQYGVNYNLGNTTGTTNTTLGVPTVATTGQTIGTSQNKLQQDAFCTSLACADTPRLLGTSISNICPSTTVNLNNAIYGSTAKLVWFTNNTHTGTNYAIPTAAVAGKYYAFYFDSVSNCYSVPTDSLIATTISCTPPTASSCPNVEYITNGSFENHINKCVNFTVGTIPTNNVYGWYDGTVYDPTFMMYDSVNSCIYNMPASNYPSASALTGGHTGQAWMGIAQSKFSEIHALVQTMQNTLAPGTHTLTFWAGVLPQIQPFFGGYLTTGPTALKVLGYAPGQAVVFNDWGAVTGTLLGSTPVITNYITTNNQTWAQYTMTITNTSPISKLSFFHNNNAYVYLDDVSILDANPKCCTNADLTGTYCDLDKDSVINANDLDDDNDGIQDAIENPSCFYTASEVTGNASTYATTVKLPIITEMRMSAAQFPLEAAFDGVNPYSANTLPALGSGWSIWDQDWVNKTLIQWQYNAAIPVTQFTVYQNNYANYMFGTAGSTIKLQGSTNGTNWVDLSTPVSAYTDVAFSLPNTLQAGNSFSYYRLRGVTGSSLRENKAIVEIAPTINASAYNPSTNPKTSCVALDTDKDGIANQFDLDADGDGCPDAIEGGSMLNISTLVNSTLAGGNTGSIYNGTTALPVTQNLGNTVGMTPTTMGIPTVVTTGQTIGTSADKTQKNAQCYLLAFNTDPDQNVGVANKPISGNLSTNDEIPTGTTYSNPVAQTGNPATTLPTVNPDGTYTFTATIPGEYKFLVSVCPNGLTTNCPTEQLFINVLNAAPIANVDLSMTKANTPDTINVKSNDLAGNPNGTLGTPSIVTSPLHGTATIDPTGKIIYVPATNYTGADTIYYKICETPSNLCDTTVVYIDVVPSVILVDNTLVDDNKSTLQNAPLTIPVSQGVLANDQTTGTSPLVATAQTKTIAGKGTLILNPNGSYTFTPALDFVGSVDFPYEACSGTTCDSATVHIVITPFESTPDMNAGLINKPILGNVKTNDVVPTGTTYSNPVAQPSNPSTSTPTVNPDGTYTFTTTVPGEYKFNVSVCPPNVTMNCPKEELTISVLDVNNKPIAAQDFGTTKVNVKDTINILTNDMSGNLGGTLGTPAIVTNPKNGTASIDPTTGKLIYTPTTNFVGKDTVYYKVCEVQNGKCDTTSVIITVDSTPTIIVVATDDNKTTFMNTPVTVSANNGVLTNDESTGTSPLTTIAQTTTIPNKGTLVMNTDGSYTFTPAATFSGSVDFPYTACGSTICDNATLHIVITPMDPAPDQNSGLVNKTILGNLSTNDDMPLNSTYSAPVAQSGNPTSSLPALNPDGTYAFVGTTPGEYNFLVSVCPPTMTVNCPKELLTIHVTDNASPSNKPTTNIDNSTTKLNTPDTLNILANDMAGNIGGTLTTPSIVSAPKNGTASIDPTTGKLIYTPNTSFAGIDTVVYKVCETPSGKCDSTLAIITVNPAFDSLSIAAIDDNNVTFQNTPLTVSAANGVLNNDKYTGVGTKMVTPQTTTIANKGTLTLNADGSYTFTPVATFTGSVDFPYTVCVATLCDKATLHILVDPKKTDTLTKTPVCATCPVTFCTTSDDLPKSTATFSTCSTPAGYTKTGPDANGCYTYTPNGTVTSPMTTCQVSCIGSVCDTTIIVIKKPITADTVTTTPSCPTCPVTVCTTGDDIANKTGATYSTCSTPAGYTKSGPDANGCYIYTPNGSVTTDKTTCQVICNNGVCDTTYVTLKTPTALPPTKDTVVTPAPACPTCPVTACTVGDDIPAGGTPTYSTCSTPAGYAKTGPDANGCYTYTPTGATTTGLVQTCQVKCVGTICDTTIVIIPTPIKPDTVTTTPSCPTCPVTVCTTGNDVPAGGTPTYSTCSTPARYTKTGPDANGCYIYTPNGSVTSPVTTCQVKCNLGVCDTTYVTINKPTPIPATLDTVVTPAPACPTCPVTACTVGDDIPAGGTPTYSTCSTPAGYTKTGPDANGCYTYTPTGATTTGLVQTCQVKCVGTICDTTIVIIPTPIKPDTVTTTPSCPTCPVTVCTTGNDVPSGGTPTYSTCSTPAGYTKTGPDANGCYTYTPNGSVTSPMTTCQVKCVGTICDTTYVKINVPTSLPPTPDTVVTPAPACPTCPVTACTVGDDIPAGGTPTYSTCSTPAGYTKTGPDANGCFTYTPTGTVTSPVTTCQVKCLGAICDTTYVILPRPITPDTVVVTPTCATCPVTACTVMDDLPNTAGTITYSTCSTPSGYTKTGPDAAGCYVYTPTSSSSTPVTTCQVACKNGVCDTTYVTINPFAATPDLTITQTVNPSNFIGVTNFSVVIKISEINNVSTNGNIVVKVLKNQKYTLTYNSTGTSIGFESVSNSDWQYSSDAVYHIFTKSSSISGNSSSSFGYTAVFDPQNSTGIFTATSLITGGSGGEVNTTNNTDTDTINYFK